MSAIPQPTDNPEILRRWAAYLEARATAEESKSVDDGVEAGRRWRAFLDLFLPAESPMPRSPLRVVK